VALAKSQKNQGSWEVGGLEEGEVKLSSVRLPLHTRVGQPLLTSICLFYLLRYQMEFQMNCARITGSSIEVFSQDETPVLVEK